MPGRNNRGRGRGGGGYNNNQGRGRGRGRGRGNRGRGRGRGGKNFDANERRSGGRNSGSGRGNSGGRGDQRSRGRGRGNRGNDRGRGNNRGGRGNRGGGQRNDYRDGGRQFSDHRPPMRQMEAPRETMRYHEEASAELMRVVRERNLRDTHGRQEIYRWQYRNTSWYKVEGLSTGSVYWFEEATNKTVKEMPEELEDVPLGEPETVDQGVSFPAPPARSSFPEAIHRHLITGILTNTYEISGSILDTCIHEYQVTIVPPIPTSMPEERRRVVLSDKTTLRRHFGFYEFDNNRLFAMGERRISDKAFDLENHRVTFTLTQTYSLAHPQDMPPEMQDQMLNVFNRKKMELAEYTNVRYSWFHRRPRENPQVVGDSCALIQGFDCSVSVNPGRDPENTRVPTFKADLAHKLVSSQTVHEILEDIFDRSRNDADFQTKAQEKLAGKFFVMTYNHVSVRLEFLDFDQNEGSYFEQKTGKRATFADYVKDKYGRNSPLRERCVLVDRKHHYYLPQHARLTMHSSDVKEDYTEILNRIDVSSGERKRKIDTLVANVNNVMVKPREFKEDPEDVPDAIYNMNSLDISFRINPRGMVVSALRLNYPTIEFQGSRGRISHPANELVWKETKGFLEGEPLFDWGVLIDRRDRRNCGDSVMQAYEKYSGMRRIQNEFGPPVIRMCNLGGRNADFQNAIEPGWKCVLVVIPDTEEGSQMKTEITKFATSDRNRHGLLTQFVLDTTCRKSAALMGCFEDMLEKWGNVLFRLRPELPVKFLKVNRLWTIGIDVSHVARKPSVACLHLNRAPLEGSLGKSHCITHLNEERREIIPFVAMVAMAVQAFADAFDAVGGDPERMAPYILVYRDGVGNGQLRELASKEVSGLKRAIREFRRQYNAKKWKPQLEVVCCMKTILDRFAIQRGREIRDVDEPIVVFDEVTSHDLWDFVLFPYHPRKTGTRNKRFVVVHDGLKLREKGRAWDLFQFTFDLTYGYCFAVPFPMGGISKPAPIAYAKHYAENFSQTILTTDAHPSELQTNPELHRPRIVEEKRLNANLYFPEQAGGAPTATTTTATTTATKAAKTTTAPAGKKKKRRRNKRGTE